MSRIKKGDLFTMEISDDVVVVGQIIEKADRQIFIVVYKNQFESVNEVKLDTVDRNDIMVLGWTMPNFFKLKRWKVITNEKEPVEVLIPNYKVNMTDGVYVMNFKQEVIRKATSEEEKKLKYMTNASPALIVGSVKAVLGLQPMDDGYAKYTYNL